MAGFNPDKFLSETSGPNAGFNPDKFLAETSSLESAPSNAMTAVRKFTQGATVGFSDEISGGLEAAGRLVGVKGAGGPMKDISVAPDGPTIDFDTLKQAYQQARDKERGNLKKDKKYNPKLSSVMEILGGVASPINKLIPAGTSGLKAGATIGAVQAAGNSTANDPLGLVSDTIEGAAVGGIAGDVFENAIIPAIKATPKFASDQAKKVADKFNEILKNKFGQNLEYASVENKQQIIDAAKTLGIDQAEIPKAVLTNNKTFQKLESGLSQSGSIPARPIREQYNEFSRKLNEAQDVVTNLKSPQSDFAIGKDIQGTMAKNVKDMTRPVSELYEDITPDLKNIPVDSRVTNRVFGDLKKNPLFQTKDGIEMLNEYKSAASSQGDLASLKEWRSTIGDSVNQNSSPLEIKRVDALIKAVTKIRDNSINIQKAILPEELHPEIDNLIDRIALADKSHASNIDELNSVKSLIGNKDVSSPSGFASRLADAKEAELATRASNLDVSSMQNLKDKFPNVFEKAKEAKINDMIQSSTGANGFIESSFIKRYNSLDQEMKDLIFSPEIQKHIDAISVIRQSVPQKLGPSGTPEGQMTMDMFSPKRNALDWGIKKTLDSVGKNPEAQSNVVSGNFQRSQAAPSAVMTPLLKVLQGGLSSNQKNPAVGLPAAAEKDKPTKGPDKWANDGANKLLQHDSTLPQELIDQLKSSKSGKDLLIRASDLKPNTKAMDNLVKQIRSSNLKGDE